MMMGNKGTFSAGSMAQGPRRGPRRPSPQQKRADTSLGYPTIEGLLETEDFSNLQEGYESAQNEAEKVLSSGQSARTKKRAKSAVAAFERGLDLLKELLEIKEQMKKGA